MKSVKSKSALRKAVERWIIAEWAFRAGPAAYSEPVAKAMLAAEDELRMACTGKRLLTNAARRVGVDVENFTNVPRRKDKKRDGKASRRRG